jgi:hypothetical protein
MGRSSTKQPRDRDNLILRPSLWLGLGAVLVVGCGSDGSAAPPAAMHCYKPDGVTAPVVGCAGSRVCVPDRVAISINSSTCTEPSSCRWMYAPNVGDTLEVSGQGAWVFLRFGTSIAGATTGEQLAAALWHANFWVQFPVEGGTGDTSAYEVKTEWTSSNFDVLELMNDRLHAKLSFTVQRPYRAFSSADSRCGESDTSSCICGYAVDVPGTIEVDLPADIPMP